MKSTKVLITAPLKQDPRYFIEHQKSLDALIIPEGVEVSRYWVVNDCPECIPLINGEFIERNTGDVYAKTANDHIWSNDNLSKMHELRNLTIKYALERGFDYWFSVDTDLILRPETLQVLLEDDKDIVAEIFWTLGARGGWWSNAWMYDQAGGNHEKEWNEPGCYKVGGTGACILVKRRVFEAGVDYTKIPNIERVLWGEDRHFCIRAVCNGFDIWLDTKCPPEHIFTEKVYRDFMRRSYDDT